MTKPRGRIGGYIAGTVVCWTLSLYVYLTADPTHLLITGRFSAAPLDPERVVWTFLILGSALFCIALWKKFFSMQ